MAVNEPIDPRVRLAISQWPDDAPRGAVSTFCAEHGISRKSFYELLKRARVEGPAAVLEPRCHAFSGARSLSEVKSDLSTPVGPQPESSILRTRRPAPIRAGRTSPHEPTTRRYRPPEPLSISSRRKQSGQTGSNGAVAWVRAADSGCGEVTPGAAAATAGCRPIAREIAPAAMIFGIARCTRSSGG